MSQGLEESLRGVIFFFLGLCYNSWQYNLPLYFVPILQMQLKDPLVFSQLDTSPQLCKPSLHSLMSTWMNQKEIPKKCMLSLSKQGGCYKSNAIALTRTCRSVYLRNANHLPSGGYA